MEHVQQHVGRCALFVSPRAFLQRNAARMENSSKLRIFPKIDTYGGPPEDGPGGRSKTVMGGFLTLIFYTVVLLVIIFNVFKLVAKQQTLSPGEPIHINRANSSYKAGGSIEISVQSMHYPVMDFYMVHDVLFYEKDAPSVQKISVIDNSRFNPSYASAKNDPPVTRSMYANVKLPFDSVDHFTLSGLYDSQTIDSNQLIVSRLAGQFSPQVQTLQLMGVKDSLQNPTFYPHNTSLYVRFRRPQLDQLLDNQLDISMYNKAEYLTKNGSRSSMAPPLQTLVTDPALWRVSSMDKPFNLLTLRSSSGPTNFSQTDAVNWLFKAQYSSNFNYTLPDFYCFDSSTHNLTGMPFTPLAWAQPPEIRAMNLTLVDSSLSTSWIRSTPFDLLVFSRQSAEKVTVVNVVGNVLHLAAPITETFLRDVNDDDCLYKAPLPYLDRVTIPPDWTCADDFYLDQNCDCDCGAPDLDCVLCKQNEYDDQCAMTGTVTTERATPYVALAVACPAQGVRIPGDGVVRGIFSDRSTGAKQCPDDVYYEGAPLFYPNGSLWCNSLPKLQLKLNPDDLQIYQSLTPTVYDMRYNATLKIGISSFPVEVEVTEDDEGYDLFSISNYPSTTPCGQRPNVPNGSTGYLRTVFKFGESIMLVSPADSGQYFPPEGPYVIQVGRQQFTVIDASCPRALDGAQVIVLANAPQDSSFEEEMARYTSIAITSSQFDVGSSYISVRTQSTAAFANTVCCYGNATIAVGDRNVDSSLYVVDGITQGLSGPSCCDVTCNNGDELFLSLSSSTVSSFINRGTRMSLVQASPTDQSCSASLSDSFVDVFLIADLTGNPTSKANAIPYEPNLRAKSFPVPDLDLELAMFIVPQKSGFESMIGLCEGGSEFVQSNDTKNEWRLNPSRLLTIDNCAYVSPTTDDSLCNAVNCLGAQLRPSRRLSFTESLPVNEKWIPPSSNLAKVDSPEYDFDVSTIYHFIYTEQDMATGKLFQANTPQDGDYDQNYKRHEFSGELDFIGGVDSDDDEAQYFPANAPILNFNFSLAANTKATNDLIKKLGRKFGVNRALGWDAQTVSRFEPIIITWPDVLPLTIQPGYNYTFKAEVTLQPVFHVGVFGVPKLSGWINSTSTSFQQVRAEFVNGNKANVRVQISFNKETTVLNNHTVYTFWDFIASLGAAFGLLGIGLSILSWWQLLTLPESPSCEEPSNPYSVHIVVSANKELATMNDGYVTEK